MRKILKPGPGWKHVGGPCWEHSNGVRIHPYGLVRLREGRVIVGTVWPESNNMDFFIKANGGNRKRGVMAWALFILKDLSKIKRL